MEGKNEGGGKRNSRPTLAFTTGKRRSGFLESELESG